MFSFPTRDGLEVRGPLAPAWVTSQGGSIKFSLPVVGETCVFSGTHAECQEFVLEAYHEAMMRAMEVPKTSATACGCSVKEGRLTYKDVIGFYYLEEDGSYYGHALLTVTFKSESFEGLEMAFQASVDEYYQWLEEEESSLLGAYDAGWTMAFQGYRMPNSRKDTGYSYSEYSEYLRGFSDYLNQLDDCQTRYEAGEFCVTCELGEFCVPVN